MGKGTRPFGDTPSAARSFDPPGAKRILAVHRYEPTHTEMEIGREFVGLKNWRRITDMSPTATRLAIQRGDLKAFKMGAKLVIDLPHGLRWIRSLPVAKFKPTPDKPAGRQKAA